RKSSLLSGLSGKRCVDSKLAAEKTSKLEKYMQSAYDVIALDASIKKNSDEIDRLRVRCDLLAPWKDLQIPFGWRGTETVAAAVGAFPGRGGVEELEKKLPENVQLETVDADKERINAAVFYLKEDKKEVLEALSQAGFVPVSDADDGLPSKIAKDSRERISKLEKNIREAEDKLTKYSDSYDDFELILDYLAARISKYRALPKLALSDSAVVVTGFVPEKLSAALCEQLEKETDSVVTLSDPDPGDDVPVLLENSRFSEPLEGITRMYSMPGKTDLDPTPIMSFFYYLLFGMMLSDAGYGILISLFTAIAVKKFKLSDSMNKTLRMFFFCGISTVFWGALFGSWFGDAPQVIAREFFGKEIGSTALWFEPIDDPIRLLLWSFAIGIAHLFWGLWAHFMNLWRQKKRLDAVLEVIPVYLFVLGVCPFGASVFIPTVDQTLIDVGLKVAVVGIVGVFAGAAVKRKNVFMGIVGGLYALYNTATGYVGDILSYSRLLALGLATGSIAGVINLLGVMVDGPLKIVIFIPVFLLGHTANLAINLLGAYVHTDRLQFVELFSKFYSGGGREFEPFKTETKYVTITEEK
ncbi:MAG: V-type ATP synthase subunit I, partial [Clostridia bacterium]|nr:V-type ATP synthase subunit I [Clostridia bacterium]